MDSSKIIHLEKTRKTVQNEPFKDVLAKYRNKAGLKQTELADMLKTSRVTIVNWEAGKTEPTLSNIIRISEILSAPLSELIGVPSSEFPTPEENRLLFSYRHLSDVGKNAVKKMADALLDEECAAKDLYLKTNYMVLPLESVRPAAGSGNEAPEIPPTPIFVRSTPQSRRADCVMQISGDSMEPFYHDGDYVLVQKTNSIDDGEIGIFCYREGFIIKIQKEHKVVSANPDRPFVGRFEEMQLVGKVLGTASQDYSEDDRISLNELFADELKKMNTD